MTPSLNSLAIEITNRCNLKCIMCCSHGDELYKGQRKSHPPYMDINFFKDIIDQYKKMPSLSKIVSPQFQGESLLHPQFTKFCEILEDAGINFRFTTNAMLLTPDISKTLLKFAHFRNISFSIDGVTKDTYEHIRVGAKFETVLSNIDTFLHLASSHSVTTSVSFTCQDSNRHELNDFIRHWHGHTDININTVCYNGRPASYFWKPKRVPCQDPFTYMAILTGGKVTPCCRDYQYTFELGDLSQQSLDEVWNGQPYNELRKAQLEGDYDKYKLCADCDTWMVHVTEKEIEYLDKNIELEKGPFWINVNHKPDIQAFEQEQENNARELGIKYAGKNIFAYGSGTAFNKYIKYFPHTTISGIILDDEFLQKTDSASRQTDMQCNGIPYLSFNEATKAYKNIDNIIIFARKNNFFPMYKKVLKMFPEIQPEKCISYM